MTPDTRALTRCSEMSALAHLVALGLVDRSHDEDTADVAGEDRCVRDRKHRRAVVEDDVVPVLDLRHQLAHVSRAEQLARVRRDAAGREDVELL